MTAWYNEHDPHAAQWLRNLISSGHIAPGDVDERSIEDVRPDELVGYTQCHFFAGIGGWSCALRLAGWPDDRPVWTGSCPCQPFSAAGKGHGFADERHLWPAFHWLIKQCRPEHIFGEQVASNLAWLDLVSGDLEGEGYTVGSVIVGAHSVGAPHIRQRLYWMAHHHHPRLEGWSEHAQEHAGERTAWSDSTTIACADSVSRPIPIEPALFPLVDGTAEVLDYRRSKVLQGIGNAIVPQVAAAFIEASVP